MERDEAEWRFVNRQPVEGLAFLLDDSVEITSGLHRGAIGSVIAIRAMDPEPVYVVKLKDGPDVILAQSEIVGTGSASALADLQRWYSSQCDGDWEHTYGIRIGTLDNPGWSVAIDLTDTALEGFDFPEVEALEPVREWIHCRVQEQRFEGHGGPHMLGRIIRIFLQWANARSGGAA